MSHIARLAPRTLAFPAHSHARNMHGTSAALFKKKHPDGADKAPNPDNDAFAADNVIRTGSGGGQPSLNSTNAAQMGSVADRERLAKSFVDAERNVTEGKGKK